MQEQNSNVAKLMSQFVLPVSATAFSTFTFLAAHYAYIAAITKAEIFGGMAVASGAVCAYSVFSFWKENTQAVKCPTIITDGNLADDECLNEMSVLVECPDVQEVDYRNHVCYSI